MKAFGPLISQKTFRYLWRFYSLLFRGFSWLFRGPLLSRKTMFGPFSLLFRGFFVAFSWLFRGPRFGQILRVLALEQSSENFPCVSFENGQTVTPQTVTWNSPCLGRYQTPGLHLWANSHKNQEPGDHPISGKTLSECKDHSRSSRRVPGYSRSNSQNSKFHSRTTKFHSRNGIPRLEQYEHHNSRSNSRSDSRN